MTAPPRPPTSPTPTPPASGVKSGSKTPAPGGRGTEVKVDGKELVILKEDDVYGVIEK